MSEELYFKDPCTGELKLDKRRSDLAYTIAKLNKQQEDVDKSILAQEKMQEARFGMFEQLLREKLENVVHEIHETREKNEEAGKQLVEKFRSYYTSAMATQNSRNDEQDKRIEAVEIISGEHTKRILRLEQAPTQQKAKYWDKVFWALLGISGAALLDFIKKIVESAQ